MYEPAQDIQFSLGIIQNLLSKNKTSIVITHRGYDGHPFKKIHLLHISCFKQVKAVVIEDEIIYLLNLGDIPSMELMINI